MNIIRVLTIIMFASFSVSLFSCETVSTEVYTPKKLKEDSDVKLIEAKTKNDSTINLSDYNVTFKEKNKNSLNILLLEKTDTIYSQKSGRTIFKTKKSFRELCLQDLKNIKVEKTKFDFGKTLLFMGITILTIMATVLIYFSISPIMSNSNGYLYR